MGNILSDPLRFRKTVLLISVVAISLLFFLMIRGFLMAILMAGIFSALARPLFCGSSGGSGAGPDWRPWPHWW